MKKMKTKIGLMIGVVVLALLVFTASATALTSINVESATVDSGDTFTINVTLSNTPASGISAYGFNVTFDPSVVQVKNVTNLPAGYTISNWNNDTGWVKFGGALNPAKGDGVFGTVTFEATGASGTSAILDMTVEDLTDGDNVKIPEANYTVTDGSVTVGVVTKTSVTVESKTVGEGETTTIDVTLSNTPASGISAYGFNVTFDPSVVQVKNVTNLPAGYTISNWNNDTGWVKFGGALNPAKGDGVFGTVTFEAIGVNGTSTALDMTVEDLTDGDNVKIPEANYTVTDGAITVGVVVPIKPTIVTYTISKRTITPPETTEIDVEFSERVEAWIKIEDVSRNLVNELYHSASVIDPDPKTWNGKYANGTIVAAGDYYVNVTGLNKTTGLSVVNDTETITVVTVGEPDLIVTEIEPKCGYLFANESNNITATVKNNGSADADAFNVSFDITGLPLTKVSVSGLAAGATTTVYAIDPTNRNAGATVTITVTADCDGAINESNETNNVNTTESLTVYNNGYKNKSFMGMDSLELFEYDAAMYGGITYNVSGTKNYPFEPAETDTRMHHIDIPAGMTVKKARLYVYWYDYWAAPAVVANLSVNFSGTTFTTPDAAYTDWKGFGSYNYPRGTYAYNVTSLVTGTGDYTAILENIDPTNKTTLLGEMLFVVYEDPTETTKIQLWILEGNDLLMAADETHGKYNYAVSPEEATATVAFPGSIDVTGVSSATLISVVAQGMANGSNMLFNGEVIKPDAWDSPTEAYSGSKINVESVNVTANLTASGNNMGFLDNGTTGMQASNAILVVTVGKVCPRYDINEDGKVDFKDLAVLGLHYGETTTLPYPRYDINEDGKVDFKDLAVLGLHYGETDLC